MAFSLLPNKMQVAAPVPMMGKCVSFLLEHIVATASLSN
jgi:hypothetical protein